MVAAGLGKSILPKIVVDNSHLSSAVTLDRGGHVLPQLEVGIFTKKKHRMSAINDQFWTHIDDYIR